MTCRGTIVAVGFMELSDLNYRLKIGEVTRATTTPSFFRWLKVLGRLLFE